MVYYRKYRPQTMSELDSSNLRETLHAVLGAKEVPHAFLFTGPKGLGKTSTARIVAKVVNCEHLSSEGEPDNSCEQCISITNGTSVDVLEIDGASNRGIDEIRELRERVKLAPSSSKKKVYIIDEVHMLTTEAFNALLKTIEEPPSHVMFIFCTTEPHKVPATILSRCLHITLTPATEEELVHSMQRVVKGEKLTVEEGALLEIAKMADGGFRDAIKMLEEMVSLAGGNPISKNFVEEKLHIQGTEGFQSKLLTALLERDTKGALDIVSTLVINGMDMKYFLREIIQNVHGQLLSSVGIKNEKKSQFSLLELQYLLTLFSEAIKELKFAVIPQLPLEMAIILFTQSSSQENIVSSNETIVPQVQKQNMHNKNTIDMLIRKQQNIKIQAILKPDSVIKPEPAAKPVIDQVNIADSNTIMENIIYKVKPLNHSLAGVLRGCKVQSLDDKYIILEASYKFHKEKLEERAACEIIEKAVREITGKPLGLKVVLKEVTNI